MTQEAPIGSAAAASDSADAQGNPCDDRPGPARALRTMFVTVEPAFPPVSGADLRNWQNASAASRLGPVLLTSILPPDRPECSARDITIVGLSNENRASVLRRPAGGTEIDVAIPRAALDRFAALARSHRPDTIVLESMPTRGLLGPARTLADTVVLDMHNIESRLVAQRIERPLWRHPLRNLGIDRQSRQVAAAEREAVRLAHQIWVCSTPDRDRLESIARSHGRIRVVPNGIPRPEEMPRELTARQPASAAAPHLLFMAYLSYPPNVAAARWLAQELMPALQRSLPLARLVLAGRNPHADVRALARPGSIEVIADPPQVSQILRRCDIAVLPIRQGGGTRIKALEAMAWGLPVVATALAVEGLGLTDGVDVLIAETVSDLVLGITSLATNPARFDAMRTTAWRNASSRYGATAIAAAVSSALLAQPRARLPA
jgi:glycosyltransferase involved in cell wall biosynthesis